MVGVNGETPSGFDFSKITHTDAHVYVDHWTFDNPDYMPASGTVTDLIGKAQASIVVASYSATYDGNSHTATGTATGVKGGKSTALR